MAIGWSTEAIPIPATLLLPIDARNSSRRRRKLRLHAARGDTTQHHRRLARARMPIQAIINAGFVLNLFGIVLVTLPRYLLVSWIWGA